MKSFIAALRTLVLPWGRTTGTRIVLDGVNGRILIYDASNTLIAEISPTIDPDGLSSGGYWTRGFQSPDPIYSFLGGGLLALGPIPETVCDEHAYLNYQTDSGFSPQYSVTTLSSGIPDSGYNPARIQLVGQDTQWPQAWIDGGSSADRGDLNVTGVIRSNNHVFGRTVITPVANTPTSTTVMFGFTLAGTVSRGQATADTAVIGSTVQGVAISSLSMSQMLLWIYRTNTTNTGVYWDVWSA